MKITENITATLNMTEIVKMIEEHASKEDYDVLKVTPEFQNEYSLDRNRDGEIIGQRFTGFIVELKRKPQINKRMM